MSDWVDANRANWDARTSVHAVSASYDVDGFIAAPRGPRAWELDYLGDVNGLGVVHLQCHIGLDTLALAHAGATITGLDFSPAAIATAVDIAVRSGLSDRARFVLGDVHHAVGLLGNGCCDLVYVSLGALCWLPRVDPWAAQVAALLRPGGRLYLHDTHPLAFALDDDGQHLVYSYFETEQPVRFDDGATYTDGPSLTDDHTCYEWNHSLGEIITALTRHGLSVDRLDEHPWTTFPQHPTLRPDDGGRWQPPPGDVAIPRSYTLTATKPTAPGRRR